VYLPPLAVKIGWQARNVIILAQKPLTVNELAIKLRIPLKDAKQMVAKDQANKRKVFFVMGDGSIWVSSLKLPKSW